MTSLYTTLDEMGLAQYAQAFTEEGFDTWTTLLDIIEPDLEALGVKLGHRRKLQRAIADYREKTRMSRHDQPRHATSNDEAHNTAPRANSPRQEAPDQSNQRSSAKRKYRRHPKPDEHAPERPPSAYVIFSNQMREALKGRDLSFTEIAKLVGERWQNLEVSDRAPCEKQAQQMKEKYYTELSDYKKTEQYKTYQKYLDEFKSKHNQQNSSKRSKTESQPARSRHGSSHEPTIDENASRTDDSARDEASPGSVTQEYSFRRPDNPAVWQWRSAVGKSITPSKYSPTASSQQMSTSSRLPNPPSEGNPPKESNESDSRDLPPHTTGLPPARPHPARTSLDVTRHGWRSRRPSNVSDSLPSLIREDTSKTTQSSEVDTTVGQWQRPLNPPLRPKDSYSNPPYDDARVLPLPRSFPLISNNARSAEYTSTYGSSPAFQPKGQPYESIARRTSQISMDNSAREDDPIANSSSPGSSRPESKGSPHSGTTRYSTPHDWAHLDSQKRRDIPHQYQKVRASMGLATLLRASEHLDEKSVDASKAKRSDEQEKRQSDGQIR